jgi:phospho-N-acetylmuramoyl-pentapeptide-transferase
MLSLIWAIIVSFAVALCAGLVVIPVLRKLKAGQQVRDDGPKTHLVKAGTPTMGGIIILAGAIVSSFVFSKGNTGFTIFAVISMSVFAAIGFWDDFIKLFKKRSLGLRVYQKLILQFSIGFAIAVFAYFMVGSKLIVPFSDSCIDLGVGYIPFTAFVIVAIVNAVNLTDGLDGLAAGVTLVDTVTFMLIFMVLAGIGGFSSAPADGDMFNMMIFSASLSGACLGFLMFNRYPAKVFMGDTGSFALGGALVMIGILSRMQLMLPVIGVMFVLSAVSVLIQVGSYKLRKKRVFKMAPLHHHFELSGMHETKVVAMYMIITAVICAGALLLLKGTVCN